MTKDQITAWAREAFIKRGFWPNEVMWECWKDAWLEGAAAAKAEENEACAKVCDAIANKPSNVVLGVALECADAIRARRNTQ